MSRQAYSIAIIAALAGGWLSTSVATATDDRVVRFDLPPVVAAFPADEDPSDPTLVTFQLRLSSMIETPEIPRIDQWLVRCQPRGNAISIADYAPRTETASGLASPIQVKKTTEQANAVGVSLDGAYGHIAHGKAGVDRSNKNTHTLQFDRIAPEQTVTASGTINRGRGVYFKLRWTAQQILDGEKLFSVTLKVPPTWRGSLVDVSVVAQSERKAIAPWDRETQTIGSAIFVVAAYRHGDQEAGAHATALAEAEYSLRRLAAAKQDSPQFNSLPSMWRQVAMKWDPQQSAGELHWMQRLLLDRADPHLDKEICKLPMPIRVAVLDYVDVREAFLAINENAGDRVLAAKPAQ